MLTRRSILRGLLSGAVAAVARVSPLVATIKPIAAAEPVYHTTFRWDCGLMVRDLRATVRLRNIEAFSS